jgi:hypothetical protein
MPQDLPPDLSRLGAELAAATDRAVGERRLRRARLLRLGACGLAAVLALGALPPSRLGPADRAAPPVQLALTATPVGFAPRACDQPRGARFGLPGCPAPIRTVVRRPSVAMR